MRPGDRLGPYEVLAKLGEGGMGELCSAGDTGLARTVAMLAPDGLVRNAERRTRIRRRS
jgi:hypothetical protein